VRRFAKSCILEPLRKDRRGGTLLVSHAKSLGQCGQISEQAALVADRLRRLRRLIYTSRGTHDTWAIEIFRDKIWRAADAGQRRVGCGEIVKGVIRIGSHHP
jgi:hypothetical protein